jgi:GNAT superfamily N-acetyltransferase
MLIEPLSPAHLPMLEELFAAASCACHCRYWHFEGTKNDWLDRCANRPDENRAELEAAARAGDPSARGLVAIDGQRALGWMKLTPRQAVGKLRRLPVYKSLDLGDDATTYSIACLLVRPESRRRGVARALVAAADRFATLWGAHAIEAYPRRSTDPLYDEEAWLGPESLFRAAGFTIVHDDGPYPVLRKTLEPPFALEQSGV